MDVLVNMFESRIIGRFLASIELHSLIIYLLSRLDLVIKAPWHAMLTLLVARGPVAPERRRSAWGQLKDIVSHPSFQSHI
jgi:hypothetical protein